MGTTAYNNAYQPHGSLGGTKGITYPNDMLSMEKKLSNDWLKEAIDYTIIQCINPWYNEQISNYKIISGKRDMEKFEYITKTYGIEFPATLTHIPLIRHLLDVLIGEERTTNIPFKVSHRSNDGVMQRQRRQMQQILDESVELARKSSILHPGKSQQELELHITNEIKGLIDKSGTSFKDIQEIISQRVMTHLIESCHLRKKTNMLFRDFLINGVSYYRAKILNLGEDPEVTILNPVNFACVASENIDFVRDAERARYTEYMTPLDIINHYGMYMEKEDLCTFNENNGLGYTNDNRLEIAEQRSSQNIQDLAGTSTGNHLYEVNHCEWKSNQKVPFYGNQILNEEQEFDLIKKNKGDKISYRYRIDRYEGIRIGGDIYVKKGLSQNVLRRLDRQWYAPLSFNGIHYNKRNSKPYSVVNMTSDLQDKYDILFYHYENIVATSGTKGTRVVLENIPKEFGDDLFERMAKYMYYKKHGLEVISLSQDGVKDFAHYGDFNNSLDGSIQYILKAMEYLEAVAEKITGVPRQRFGQLSQYDLVGNTEVAMQQSALTTKPLYAAHFDLVKELMYDVINLARISWKEGKKGVAVLGSGMKEVFTIDTEWKNQDIDIILGDIQAEAKRIELFKQMTMEFVKAQAVEFDVVLESLSYDTVTEIKEHVKKALTDKKESQLEQMQQQLVEYQKQLEQITKQYETLEKQHAQAGHQEKQVDLQLKQTEIENEKEFNDKKLEIENEKIKLERERVELERQQLYVNPTGPSAEIKNN